MSTSQDIIVCEVCEIEPLQHFCNQCEVRLCNNCVIKHLGSESVEGHTIVRFKYRDARNVKPKQCSTHRTENKTLFCKNCVVQICTKGFLEHLEHEVTDLKQFIHSKYVDIDKDMSLLRMKVQPDFESGIEKLNQIYEEASARYDQERQRMVAAEKDLHDKVTAAMKALLEEMETRRNETLTRLTDLKTNVEAKLQTLDEFIDKCEAAKTSVEDILTIRFDEGLLDMEHSIKLVFPQYVSPNKWTVDVGAFKSIPTRRRIFEIDVGKDIQLPVLGRVMLEKHSTSTGKNGTPTLSNTKDYISKVIQEFEKNPLYPEASKEYEDLLMGQGYRFFQPVTPFKEESVTAEQREYKPNLAKILLLANKDKFVNAGMAWMSYVYLLGKHKLAVSQQEPHKDPSTDEGGQTGNDSVRGPVEPGSQMTVINVPPQQTGPMEGKDKPDGKTQEEVLNLFDLLEKETNKETDEYEEAHQDLVHMFTCQAVLRSSFPHANILPLVTVNISKPEEVPELVRERALYRYLANLKPELYDKSYTDVWREYGTLLMAEALLDLAKKANGPDRNIYVVVEKKMFYTMQTELQEKTQEVEELSTRAGSHSARNPEINRTTTKTTKTERHPKST